MKEIKKLSCNLTVYDKIIWILAKIGFSRMSYCFNPGLYKIGNPDENSHLLVTSNYKLSVDCLRESLKGINCWLLVLDTNGINVWCAAGKGTFGTSQIIDKINELNIKKVINHNNIIIPQLGASGICGFKVKKETGFNVIFGPVRADDIPLFLKNNCIADDKVRQVEFNLKDRLVLTPVEIILSLKYFPVFIIIFLIKNFFQNNNFDMIFYDLIPFAGALFIGCVLIPALLPYIPFRAFSLKGFFVGFIYGLLIFKYGYLFNFHSFYEKSGVLLLLTAYISYLALNFTGSSTYTSYSGVKKEIKYAIPTLLFCFLLGFILVFF
ncbi:MAG: mercury methylation corrinoid protein HgcA [Candidatus Muiribacteriota bacterium]